MTSLDHAALPSPVLDAEPALLELYRAAWELAYDHVVSRAGVPRSPYMDEGFDPDTIWIWDTCFMAHFCKYAPDLFPGVESFDNFYGPMYGAEPSSLRIHHPDNPPLFAWSEEEYVRHTGDLDRVRWLLRDRRFLQQHFAFMEGTPAGSRFPHSTIPTTAERVAGGYRWEGVTSGMDNTPRAPIQGEHGTSGDILWFDLAAQQALSARSIAALARLIGDDGVGRRVRRAPRPARRPRRPLLVRRGRNLLRPVRRRAARLPPGTHARGVLAAAGRGVRRRAGRGARGRAGRPRLLRRIAALAVGRPRRSRVPRRTACTGAAACGSRSRT